MIIMTIVVVHCNVFSNAFIYNVKLFYSHLMNNVSLKILSED